jgi:hypothetical protein
MPLAPETKVRALNDRSATPRVGTVIRLLRQQPIAGVNEGVLDVLATYLVRWPMPDGTFVDAEAPGASLVVVDDGDGS